MFRKRRAQRRSPIPIAVSVLDLDEDETAGKGIKFLRVLLRREFSVSFIFQISCSVPRKAIIVSGSFQAQKVRKRSQK